jgi:hypothetical protein
LIHYINIYSNMLSRLFLRFSDMEMRDRYNLEKKEFYKKAIPIITSLVFILAVTLEVIYRVVGYG